MIITTAPAIEGCRIAAYHGVELANQVVGESIVSGTAVSTEAT